MTRPDALDFDDMLDALIEGRLSRSAASEFDRLLIEDASARRRYVDFMRLHGDLRRPAGPSAVVPMRRSPSSEQSAPRRIGRWTIAVVVALVFASDGAVNDRPSPSPRRHFVGQLSGGLGRFSGHIAHVAVYDRVLAAGTIRLHAELNRESIVTPPSAETPASANAGAAEFTPSHPPRKELQTSRSG